jgi:hypothetical protein
METPGVSESELRMTALASAMAAVLATAACENALLRSILTERGLISDDEWTAELKRFAALKWKFFENKIHSNILRESKRVLARMKGGKTR